MALVLRAIFTARNQLLLLRCLRWAAPTPILRSAMAMHAAGIASLVFADLKLAAVEVLQGC